TVRLVVLLTAMASWGISGAGDVDKDTSEGLMSTVQLSGINLPPFPTIDDFPVPPAASTFTLPLENRLEDNEARWYRWTFQLPESFDLEYWEVELGVNDEFAVYLNGVGVAMQSDTSTVNFEDPFPGFRIEPGGAFDTSVDKLNFLSVPADLLRPGQNELIVLAADTVAGGSLFRFDADYEFGNEFRPIAGVNDSWFNPRKAGQGFFFTYFPVIDQLFGAWFTFDVERPPDSATAVLGEPGHRWLTFQGPGPGDSDTASLTLFETRGMIFDSGEPLPETVAVGTLEVFWHDCGHAHVRYELPAIDEDDDIPLQRIVDDNTALCEALREEE
ncbi:MAG: hypothetical protein AAGH19_06335, partial [Pseudomonadota bacterium]